MPIDTEIAAFKGCPIPLVNSLAESAQQLIDKCDAAAKISKKSGTKVNDFVAKAHQKVRTLRFINCLMGEKIKACICFFILNL